MEGRQVVVSVGCECGSGGYWIAERAAERLGIPCYGSSLLQEIALGKGLDAGRLEKYNGAPPGKFRPKVCGVQKKTPQWQVFRLQCGFLRKKAAQGESFLAVGHCLECIFKDQGRLASVFISGDIDRRVELISENYGLSLLGCQKHVYKEDRRRKAYYESYSGRKWGRRGDYDLAINSSRLGVRGAVVVLEAFIRERGGIDG